MPVLTHEPFLSIARDEYGGRIDGTHSRGFTVQFRNVYLSVLTASGTVRGHRIYAVTGESCEVAAYTEQVDLIPLTAAFSGGVAAYQDADAFRDVCRVARDW